MQLKVRDSFPRSSACWKGCCGPGKLSVTGGKQGPFRNVVKGILVPGARLTEIRSRDPSHPRGP